MHLSCRWQLILLIAWLMIGCSPQTPSSAKPMVIYGVAAIGGKSPSAVERADLASELRADDILTLVKGVDLIVESDADGKMKCRADQGQTANGLYHERLNLREGYSVVQLSVSRDAQVDARNERSEILVITAEGNAEQVTATIFKSINTLLQSQKFSGNKIFLRIASIRYNFSDTPPTFNADVAVCIAPPAGGKTESY